MQCLALGKYFQIVLSLLRILTRTMPNISGPTGLRKCAFVLSVQSEHFEQTIWTIRVAQSQPIVNTHTAKEITHLWRSGLACRSYTLSCGIGMILVIRGDAKVVGSNVRTFTHSMSFNPWLWCSVCWRFISPLGLFLYWTFLPDFGEGFKVLMLAEIRSSFYDDLLPFCFEIINTIIKMHRRFLLQALNAVHHDVLLQTFSCQS